MKLWPDPRFPERKISRFEIAIVSALAIIPTAAYLYGLIEPFIRSLIPS